MRLVYAGLGMLALLTVPGLAPAITVGHTDTFEDGTTMGWVVGTPLPFTPLVIEDGGPGGVGDAFLQLTATGSPGAGGKMVAINTSANWTGNFLGIPAIRMDLNNFGPSDLHLRLLFEDFDGPGPPVNLALSGDAVVVPAGSGWVSVLFPLNPAAIISGGLGTVAGALGNVDVLRIFHNPEPEFLGPPNAIPDVNAVLGIDNIQAVPEPGTVVLLACGLVALYCSRRSLAR